MRFALFTQSPETAAPALREAEQQGYDEAWLGAAGAGFGGATHLALAGIAARTRRIGLRAAITLSAAAHPVRLAEEIAVLDLLSGGRFGWSAAPPDDTQLEGAPRFREQLEVIERALSGDRFSHTGEHFQIPELQCLPAPERQPQPPAAVWTRSARRDPFTNGRPRVVDPGLAIADLERDREHRDDREGPLRAQSDRERAAAALSLVRFVYVAPTEQDARNALDGHPAAACAVAGDAAHCREQIAEIRERSGARTLITWHGLGVASGARDAAAASQRRFIEDVAPAFA